MISNPGSYVLAMDEYLKDPCPSPSLSRSMVKLLVNDVPYRAWFCNSRLNPNFTEECDSKFDMGVICHALFLEGLDVAYPVEFDDWRTKASRTARDEARELGKVPILRRQYDEAREIVSAAKEQLESSEIGIKDLQQEGDSELSYIWQEKEIWCRTRPDWISKDKSIVLDTKFTGMSASPDAFDRIVVPNGYEIQASLYSRGVEVVDGIKPTFIFCVIEVAPPYLMSLISLSPQYENMGHEKVELGMSIWRKCLKENNWPGYSNRIYYLDPKPWAVASWDERRFGSQLAMQPEEQI